MFQFLAFALKKTECSASCTERTTTKSQKMALTLSLALCLLPVGSGTAVADQQAGIDWKTLPEYMAMDRDEQRHLILHTRRLVMHQLAQKDLVRAECVSWLFDFNKEEGRQQFYNTKGLLKAAAEKGIEWKAQQLVAQMITKEFCPSTPSGEEFADHAPED